jgi:putative ATP-dependent endonuclease of OLD family
VNGYKNDNGSIQILISTHSSFVANKLGIANLILLNDTKFARLDDLTSETQKFFEKLSGYDTLRLILCKKAILVEGDSDELVVQKAFMISNNGKLPIEEGVDVISVGTSFLRFLEIAEKIEKNVAVVTDNDGNIDAINNKYINYLGENEKSFINICFDKTIDAGLLEKFNYNTLEPKILKANGLQKMNTILETSYDNENDMNKYMNRNKVECALKIFETKEDVCFPQYILESIKRNE